MERCWFNSMVFKKELKRKYDIKKSTSIVGSTIKPMESEDWYILYISCSFPSWKYRNNSSYSNVSHLFAVKAIRNFISDDTFLVRDSNGDSYSIYFVDIETHIFEIENNRSFLSELESSFPSYRNFSYINSGSTGEDSLYNHYMYDTQSSWNNHITSCIDSYLQSQICVDTPIVSDSSDSYISECVFEKGRTRSESGRSSIQTRAKSSDLTLKESSNDLDATKKYKYLWVQCENCYALNYNKFLKSQMKICEQCGYHFQMSNSERIEVLIDPGTWDPIDDRINQSCSNRRRSTKRYSRSNRSPIDFYQKKTGLTKAVQTGVGQLNGIPAAIGVVDFRFMGGSMGAAVGEKTTRLIEYATNKFLPLIIVCASGGARVQEGSLSLMQMAKISSALYDYQSNKKLLYVSILTSPTTGGITTSFGMLGDIIIAEPNSYIAFSGKRGIEQTLNKTVPEDSQAAEYLFHKGLFDLIVPRNLLKSVLVELFKFHAFFPLNYNSIK
uniref:Acetyl-coenzyme A carboxylase carboxyl transferase subunit beta, chloroplastic n=1 Tax=Pedicularis muscicola TaxID=1348741 RepID=A0A6G7SDQ1_9LAMI|nr:acetyl-CoA carboxylase carboxyltransferase beta subunit [Pedicularis muscicola]QIJ99896.1 acetyl-CoA carboxylase carboxyltransferase beta subunit [Pedicularis muscicola]